MPLGVNQYRQNHAGPVKQFSCNYQFPEDYIWSNSIGFTLKIQLGKSQETVHKTYGISDWDLRRLQGFEIKAFQNASRYLHMALHLRHEAPCIVKDSC